MGNHLRAERPHYQIITPDDSRQFLTSKEAADYLRITEIAMWRIARNSKINGCPVRRLTTQCYRFPTREFVEWARNEPKAKEA